MITHRTVLTTGLECLKQIMKLGNPAAWPQNMHLYLFDGIGAKWAQQDGRRDNKDCVLFKILCRSHL